MDNNRIGPDYEALEDLLRMVCGDVAEEHGMLLAGPSQPIFPEYNSNDEPIEGSVDKEAYEHIRQMFFQVPNGWRPGMHTRSVACFDLREMQDMESETLAQLIFLKSTDAILSIKELMDKDAVMN